MDSSAFSGFRYAGWFVLGVIAAVVVGAFFLGKACA